MTRSTGTFVHRALERASAGAAAIALTLFALVSVDARAAGSQTTSASMKVAYSEAAITSTSGAAEVYRKLKRAARKVCDPYTGPRTLQVHAAINECIDVALADAVRKIDRPKLTALHAAETRSLG